MTKTQKIIYYVLLIVVSIIFIAAGVPKLMDTPMAQASFTVAHLSLGFMYFIGVAELLGVIGLWIRSLQRIAAYGLCIILLGAIVLTAIYQGVALALFPLITLILLITVVRLGRKRRMTVANI